MSDMILVYVTCESVAQAKKIGRHLLKKKLAGCVNIYPQMRSMFLWPPESGTIDESKEVTLIVKTVERKWKEVEKEITKVHSFDTPCIIAIPVKHVAKKYYDWIVGEIE